MSTPANLSNTNQEGAMTYNKIRCEAVTVNTVSHVCSGVAKTEQGEVFVIGARTPDSKGICCQALTSISSMKLAMSLTDKMDWEKNEYFDVTCPHGVVTYRLSRMME
jgi:hypothetical protein